MAAEAGLELPIGLTEQKFMQQLARIEARAVKSARTSQQAFVAANDNIGRSFGNMSRQATAQLQNVSFQLQDILVQVAGGQGLGRALGQQLPQLLGGFGALGAVLGVVAGAGIGLASMFMGTGKEAKTLDDAIKELNGSLKSYYDAVEAANVPTAELVEKYGAAAGSAQRLLEQLAQIAKLDAASTLRASADAIRASFEDLPSILALVDAELASFGEGSSGVLTLADELKDSFGLTIDQARELMGIMSDQQAAATPQEMADAMLRMAEFMGRVNEETGYTNAAMIEANKAAAEGALASQEMAVAMEGAAAAAGGVLAATDALPGSINAATGAAVNLARALAAAIGAAQSLPGAGFGAPSLGRFGNGEDITRRAGGADLQEQQTFRYDWLAQMEAAEKAARKGAGRKKGAGRGRKGKEERPFFEDVERDLVNLERQLTLIGKTSEEVATMEARWAMLDEAKKRGITVNETLNAQIEAQAAKVGALTAELERGELAYEQFSDGIGTIVDALFDAGNAGENFVDRLKRSLVDAGLQASLASLKSSLTNLFAPAGGGGGFAGNFLGSIFGKTPSFDGGGFTGLGGRAGGIDGKGGFPAILHPNETVVDHSKGHRMGGASSVALTIDLRGTTGDRELDQKIAQAGQKILSQVPSVMDNVNKRQR